MPISSESFDLIITSMSTVTVAGLGVMTAYITANGKRTKKIQEQVTNDHETNLREELDKRHSEVLRSIRVNTKRVDQMNNDLSYLIEKVSDATGRITILESELKKNHGK